MKLVTLKTFDNSAEAYIVKNRLENEGIQCALFDENVAGLTGMLYQTTGTVKLKVDEADVDKALETLARSSQ